jgi:hypothetical protein
MLVEEAGDFLKRPFCLWRRVIAVHKRVMMPNCRATTMRTPLAARLIAFSPFSFLLDASNECATARELRMFPLQPHYSANIPKKERQNLGLPPPLAAAAVAIPP